MSLETTPVYQTIRKKKERSSIAVPSMPILGTMTRVVALLIDAL